MRITEGDEVIVDLPGEYIRSVLGLVATLIDEELPALLDKTYINRGAEWKHEMEVMILPSGMFSGEW